MFQKIDTGNRNNSYEKWRRNCDDLPFAGITLFRFNGFFSAFYSTPRTLQK
jgi:hypothetical protein